MKFDAKTIAVLENFQAINPAIVIEPGSVLKTISVSGSIFASAKVPEVFPLKIGIYELSKFLGILSLSKESDVEFKDGFMIISQGDTKVRYSYSDTSLIETPPDGDVEMDATLTFNLSADVLTKVLKAAAVLKYNEVAITGRDGILSIATIASKDPENATRYSVNIGTTDKDFTFVIGEEILRLVKTDYKVTIDKGGISHFFSPSLEYWIGLSEKSKYEE